MSNTRKARSSKVFPSRSESRPRRRARPFPLDLLATRTARARIAQQLADVPAGLQIASCQPARPFGPVRAICAAPALFFSPWHATCCCMTPTISLRKASLDDLSAVDRLLARSYPRLLVADYPPSVMVLAVPIIARARPGLLASGRYLVAVDAAGVVVAAGGWSAGRQGGDGQVRHVATDPSCLVPASGGSDQ